MIRNALAAATLLAATPALGQSTTQGESEPSYDRALAAGYKALFLCSAIANAERSGTTRGVSSVEAMELTGIQQPMAQTIGALDANIVRRTFAFPSPTNSQRTLRHSALVRVEVAYAPDTAPRIAARRDEGGCSLLPIGMVQVPWNFKEPTQEKMAANINPAPTAPPALPGRNRYAGIAIKGFSSDYGEGTRTTAVLLMRDGRILDSAYSTHYGPHTPQRTWSVAKSIAATLVGAAVYRRQTSIDASAGLGSGEQDPRSMITLDHALRMASGRTSDTAGNRTDPLYFGGSTVEETALHWPLAHAPGTVFRYANNDTLAAIESIENTFADYPPAKLFEQMGMNHTVAETDWKGSYILSSQVWSTAPDLAKLGQLYLDDGVLPDGTRILPEGWMEYVSSPSGPQPDGPFGYGAGFWLFNQSEGIPPDTFAAMGNRGQFIIIVPSQKVVIVRRGEDPAGSRFDIAAFTRDMLKSLEN